MLELVRRRPLETKLFRTWLYSSLGNDVFLFFCEKFWASSAARAACRTSAADEIDRRNNVSDNVGFLRMGRMGDDDLVGKDEDRDIAAEHGSDGVIAPG